MSDCFIEESILSTFVTLGIDSFEVCVPYHINDVILFQGNESNCFKENRRA